MERRNKLNRMEPKECCIFHKKKRFDESSSEEDSDSDEAALHDEQCDDVNCPVPHLNRSGNLWQTTGRSKKEGRGTKT